MNNHITNKKALNRFSGGSKWFMLTCLVACFFLSYPALASAQEEATINVTYNIAYGGLLWVNGTSIVNASTVAYANNTLLVLAATPTNANYSYASMDLNGTVTVDNPAYYNLTAIEVGVFNQTISVSFVAEAVPTPEPTVDPEALTIDDSVGLAVALFIVAVSLPVALIVIKRGEER